MIDHDDTIVAIASPTTPAPRGIVRLSGPQTATVLIGMGIDCPTARRPARFTGTLDLGDPLGSLAVDVMLWPTSRSYTGQPAAELHALGCLPVLRAMVDQAIRAGARAARPGEFTMRAFLAGRLDLTQAEAVLGVIEAEGKGSLNHALRQLAGNLARPLNESRSSILNLLADVEAGLDFVDEDIEFISDEVLIDRLTNIGSRLDDTIQLISERGGGAARPVIALRGQPNAGKSSLMNRLSAESVAIVTDVAGTTRDTVSQVVTIDGIEVLLLDTAGVEDASDAITAQSQQQAARAARDANIRIWCVDQSNDGRSVVADQMQRMADGSRRSGTIDLWVATKSDLQSIDPARQSTAHWNTASQDWIYCSAMTGEGIVQLQNAISIAMQSRDDEETGSVIGTAARCWQSLERASEAIKRAIRLTRSAEGHEFVSAELRMAADYLGEVTGAVYTDDILDRIFSRFCIGK